jgi:transposase-like protein
VLGIWWRESEGAKFWLAVLNDMHQRGVRDVLICCVDGLEGFPEAIEAVFPDTWVQTCVVHQVRASMRYARMQPRELALDPLFDHAWSSHDNSVAAVPGDG